MSHTLPELGYDFTALEPHIDAKTMEIHHGKHHAAYVAKLNTALESTGLESMEITELLKDLSKVPEAKRMAVRNNGGGHLNHSLFWLIMTPGGSNEPTGELLEKINAEFGNVQNLKDKINEAGANRFGSGWSWLSLDNGKLIVESTPNQDSPVMEGRTPLLGVDVWEHAYYLNYQNRRPDYLTAWWNVVNWDQVAKNYAEAK
jgi:Fe-Mn family superoxide dismutase